MAMINAIIGEDTKVLTSDIELRSYFVDQYKKMMNANEIESWETKYRELLNRAKGTKEYETAMNIPHRSRVGRTAPKKRKGVLLFGRKKETCIFKISKDLLDIELITPEDAFELLEANIIEEAKKVSNVFDAIYQNIKQSLFMGTGTGAGNGACNGAGTALDKTDKQKREVLDKINAIAQTKSLNEEYIRNLKSAVEMGALSGLSMQYIRQMKPKDYPTLPQHIEADFLDRVTKMARNIDEGKECLILSEELQ
jgi:hypothetical protein